MTGDVLIAQTGRLTYKSDRGASNRPFAIAGAATSVFCAPMGGCSLVRTAGGILTFEDTANAADAMMTLDGGRG